MAEPTKWALDRARELLEREGEAFAWERRREFALALDAARIEAIDEMEALVRDGLAARGIAWPTEDDLDFGGALDLAMVRALGTARDDGRREAATRSPTSISPAGTSEGTSGR
jgi:hypothetical protein